MKLFALAIQVAALNLAATPAASAFQFRAVQTRASSTSLDMSSHHLVTDPDEMGEVYGGTVYSALGTLEGPSISYGHFAVLEAKKPTDIKEYDNFDAFKNAIDQADCTKILRGLGPFTLLAPTNTAIEKFDGILTDELIKAHIIPQDLLSDEMVGSFETLAGTTVTFRKEFRKTYVDNAMIGQLDNHSGGTPYPTNIMCENGVVHAINVIMIPNYSRSDPDSQGVQGLSLQSHLKQDVLKGRGALPDSATDQH